MTISPCIYPGCRDTDGNPRLTDQTICAPSRVHYRRTLHRLVMDYLDMATTMPTPIGTDGEVRSVLISPGHPKAWASDMLAKIAAVLDETEDAIRDHLHETPSGPRGTARESRIVARAYKYLNSHFETLCEAPGASAWAVEITDLHRTIRNQLGQGQLRTHLPTPCPDCLLITLVRTMDRRPDGHYEDSIHCDNCGRTIAEEHYGLYARMLLDELIAAADTPETVTA